MRKKYVNPELETEPIFMTGNMEPWGNLRSAGIVRSRHKNHAPDLRKWRSYPYYTLNVVLENGSGAFRNETGFHCAVEFGDFFLTFPGVNHLYGPGIDEFWNEMYVGYSGIIFDACYQQKYFSAHQPVWRLNDPDVWIEKLRGLLYHPRFATKRAIAADACRFLGLLLEMTDAAQQLPVGATQRDWFDQACQLLTRDLHKVDLQAIARELGMSYPSFRLNFTRRAGMPPYQYREHKRIAAACETLRNNPSKLYKELAFSLGYSRGDHFAKQFKRHTGMLPGEYQRKFARRDRQN